MTTRVYEFIIGLISLIGAVVFVVGAIYLISEELELSNFKKYSVEVLGEIEHIAPLSSHFSGSYTVGNNKYTFEMSANDKKIKLSDAVYIIYDKKNPQNYLVKGYNDSGIGPLKITLYLVLTLITIISAFVELNDAYKVGFLEKNGRRILCELVKYEETKFLSPMIRAVQCKIPGDNIKIYRNYCGFPIEKMMKENNIKYIPLYISNTSNMYNLHCDELREIVENKRYNGHTIEELQGL